ncbi:hypothetical protein L0337_10155 [candidate division KSB1 bacterium]|nr:hypothetical protein [candidate division KSB1 bacterium]
MSVLNKIAYFQNRRDEVPNQELARELVQKKDKNGIREIAENLWSENQNVQSDCLKVSYEIGFLNPNLIAEYAGDFLKLLKSKNNRMVWGSMIALSTIAEIKAGEIFRHYEEIKGVMEKGSVITKDNGVKILAIVASKHETYGKKIFPYLLKHLETCRPKDVPQHAEKTVVAVNAKNKTVFVRVLEKRMADMKSSQAARVKKVITEAGRY